MFEKRKLIQGFKDIVDILENEPYFNSNYTNSIYFEKSNKTSIEGIYCYYKNGKYHYTYFERGSITTHKETYQISEILYWLTDSIVFSMASDYEFNNRVKGKDCRRLIFSKRLELFKKTDSKYYTLGLEYINKILENNPYNDQLFK